MATAKFDITYEDVPVERVIKETISKEVSRNIILTLTKEEAQILRDILGGAICGSGINYQKMFAILSSLHSLGFRIGNTLHKNTSLPVTI